MRARWPLLAIFLSMGVSYVAYPYVTLYRLGAAIRGADAGTLETLVDWPSVREGIKEDICDLVVDDGQPQQHNAKLPPFGASFMRGIASSTIDEKVTPQGIAAAGVATTPSRQTPPRPGADVHVDWAFFGSPTKFTVNLRTQGLADPIRLEMELRGGEWRVHRVWLPPEMLTNTPART